MNPKHRRRAPGPRRPGWAPRTVGALALVSFASVAAFGALATSSVLMVPARRVVATDQVTGWWVVPPARPAAGPDNGLTARSPGPGLPPPTRVRIPALGVDAPLEPLRLDAAGALQAPRDFARPGWYAEGTPPGDVGPAVIAGHVDSYNGPAVFAHLTQLRSGDVVEVERGDRWVRFRVVATRQYLKDKFPTADVYGPTPDPQLRLITCGGAFNEARHSYVDNVVTYAVAA